MLTEIDEPLLVLRGKKNPPAIFGHPHIIELGPSLRIDADRRAQIDDRFLEALRPHVVPPVEIARMPAFEGLQDLAVFRKIHIVRNLRRVIHVHEVHGVLP